MFKQDPREVIVMFYDIFHEGESFLEAYESSATELGFWTRHMTIQVLKSMVRENPEQFEKNHLYRVKTIYPKTIFGMLRVRVTQL